MIVRQFLNWVRTAPPSARAEATRSLAQALLFSNLDADDRVAAEGALLMMLDDAAAIVRQAMSEVFARSAEAPTALVQALALDQPSVALPVLQHSPLLLDSDLVDIVATGSAAVQCAVARRRTLPPPVGAAIAEVGCADAVLVLIRNPHADLLPFSWERIATRHGHRRELRDAMLAIEALPTTTRLTLVARLSDNLTRFVVGKNWMSAEQAARLSGDAMARAAVDLAARTRGEETRDLIVHLRAVSALTPQLILRALLSGNLSFAEAALANLSGLPPTRVVALMSETGPGLRALLAQAHFPDSVAPAFAAALSVHHEVGFAAEQGGAARLRRCMVERVLTACEMDDAASDALLVLLRRFAAEAAREEARLFCDDLTAVPAVRAVRAEPRLALAA